MDFVLQATRPLAEMHDEGIVHRDVKPSNLFLARDADGKERIKLLDFGVAAFQQPLARADSSLTLSEAVVGTPRYMAPEQVQSSSRVDARADVWALGVTLYELVAGRPPFDGQTVLAVLNQIERQEPAPLADTVPASIAAVVRDCLAKDPALRPSNARALGERLVAATGAAPRRRDLRKLLAAGLGAAAILSLVVVLLRRSADEPVPAEALSLASSSPPPPAGPPSVASLPTVAPAPPAALPPAPPSTSLLTTVSKDSSAPRRIAPRPPARGAPRAQAHPPSQDDDRIE